MVWLATVYDVISVPCESQFILLSGFAMHVSSHENRKWSVILLLKPKKKFVNKENTSSWTGDVDDNVLGTTMLYSPITTKKKTLHW